MVCGYLQSSRLTSREKVLTPWNNRCPISKRKAIAHLLIELSPVKCLTRRCRKMGQSDGLRKRFDKTVKIPARRPAQLTKGIRRKAMPDWGPIL